MDYGVFSQNEFIYPDTYLQSGKKEISLVSARGGLTATQIAFKPNGKVKVEWSGDFCDPEFYHLLPVYVARNTDLSFNGRNYVLPEGDFASWNTRKAPFWVFEVMEPMVDTVEASTDGLTAIYIKWETANLAAGDYNGTLKLTDDDGTVEIPMYLKLYPVEIPKKETLRRVNWHNFISMLDFLDCDIFSEEHWAQIKKCCELMRKARQTDIFVRREFIKHSVDQNGDNHFDFTNAKRLIEMGFDMGFSYIEGPFVLMRENYQATDLLVLIGAGNERLPAVSEEGTKYLTQFFTAWYNFLCENGWEKIAVQHINDEPGEHCLEQYQYCTDLVLKLMPGIPTIDALGNPAFAGATDILVPKANHYLEFKKEFDKIKEQRDVWFYTCCDPGGEYLNRFLDQELIRNRYMHWANYIYGLNGYLHWGFNNYVYKEMFEHCVSPEVGDGPLPSGDSHVCYIKNGEALGCVRLEMTRAGCEDYELLKMLAKKDKALADQIVNNVIRSFTDYDKNVERFEANYQKLLELL